jgi:hypothetical protein
MFTWKEKSFNLCSQQKLDTRKKMENIIFKPSLTEKKTPFERKLQINRRKKYL